MKRKLRRAAVAALLLLVMLPITILATAIWLLDEASTFCQWCIVDRSWTEPFLKAADCIEFRLLGSDEDRIL